MCEQNVVLSAYFILSICIKFAKMEFMTVFRFIIHEIYNLYHATLFNKIYTKRKRDAQL